MPHIINQDGAYFKDFGQGTTTDLDRAHPYTTEEAILLCELDPNAVSMLNIEGDWTLPNTLLFSSLSQLPRLPDSMIWVRLANCCWAAAERQALFMGTREVLRNAAKESEPNEPVPA